MEGRRILVIDDDPEILELLGVIFEGEHASVYTALNGREGLRQLWRVRPDLVILDVMMDDISGWSVCKRIRELTDVPLIMLSVLDDDEHIVHGLTLGCDDYISKPMKPAVLVARARALLRRQQAQPAWNEDEKDDYDDGYLRVDLYGKRVEVNGQRVKLTPTEYSLLELLVRNAGRICTMSQIKEQVWGGEEKITSDTVHVFISQLRRKLEPDPSHPRYLLSEYGMGYRLE